MQDNTLVQSSFSATINAPIEKVDIPSWWLPRRCPKRGPDALALAHHPGLFWVDQMIHKYCFHAAGFAGASYGKN